jgi:hypothetical protein
MAADGCLRQLQPERELGGGGRTVIEDGAGHPVACAAMFIESGRSGRGGRPGRRRVLSLARVFHNVIVA